MGGEETREHVRKDPLVKSLPWQTSNCSSGYTIMLTVALLKFRRGLRRFGRLCYSFDAGRHRRTGAKDERCRLPRGFPERQYVRIPQGLLYSLA